MTTYYSMVPGQGNSELQSNSASGQIQNQGLMFPDTTPVASSAVMSNGFLDHDMHPNNFNFNSGPGSHMTPQAVGSSFHSDLRFTGGYLENQAVSNALPFETIPSSMQTPQSENSTSNPSKICYYELIGVDTDATDAECV